MNRITKLFSAVAVVAMLLFVNSCSKDSTCQVPASLTSTSVTGTSATISWTGATATGATYKIQYRIVGAAAWIPSTSTAATASLTGLSANSNYEYQIESLCGSTTSAFSASGTFTTTGCPAGYEGTNCDVKMNAKFVGSYNVNDTAVYTSGPNGIFTYPMTVTASSTDGSTISITNFGGFGAGTTITGTVTGTNFTLNNTTLAGVAVSNATGSINNNVITFGYTATDNTGVAVDHAVGTR